MKYSQNKDSKQRLYLSEKQIYSIVIHCHGYMYGTPIWNTLCWMRFHVYYRLLASFETKRLVYEQGMHGPGFISV